MKKIINHVLYSLVALSGLLNMHAQSANIGDRLKESPSFLEQMVQPPQKPGMFSRYIPEQAPDPAPNIAQEDPIAAGQQSGLNKDALERLLAIIAAAYIISHAEQSPSEIISSGMRQISPVPLAQ